MITTFERILIWMSTLTTGITLGILLATIKQVEQQKLQIIELTRAARIQVDTTAVHTQILNVLVYDLINQPQTLQPDILPKVKDTGELSLTSFDLM